jgi:hypothetical protein
MTYNRKFWGFKQAINQDSQASYASLIVPEENFFQILRSIRNLPVIVLQER